MLAGCAAQQAYRDAREMLARDQARQALVRLEEAVRLDPGSAEYRVEYLRTRDRLVSELLAQGAQARAARQFDPAERAYRQALELHPTSELAVAGLKGVERERRWDATLARARQHAERKDAEAARSLLRVLLLESPGYPGAAELLRELERSGEGRNPALALATAYRKPISIEFKDVAIKTVFELIARSSGLNFLFDKDVRTDQRTSIYLRGSTVEAAVSRLLIANQLEQRVLDDNTVLIYPDTPAKQKDYQLLSVKSFYLSNGEAKSVANTLKTILKAKDVVVDERLNLIVLRDTPDAIRLAEKLVALHDIPEPEVMLDVEVLEVKRSRLLDLGVRWPEQVSLSALTSTTGAQLTLNDFRNLKAGTVGVTVNPMTATARNTESDANILANPRIRAKSREKARVLIGDRVPNITTTSTSTGFISDSVNYIDVGLKLEVEPVIHPGSEVSIKLSLEVSNLVSQVQTKSGTLAYQIGTRSATTVLRLRDGENQVLAGLINDEDRRIANKLPALGSIPVAGRLFGGQSDEAVKTEIVLSITPRVLRNVERPDASALEFESGTEAGLRSRGGEVAGAAAPTTPAEVGGNATTTAPAPAMPQAAGSTPNLPAGNNNTPVEPGGGVAPVAGDLSLRFRGPVQVRSGQLFSVDLMIDDAKKGLLSLPLALGFDPAAVQVMSVEQGDFMKQGGVSATMESRIDPDGQVLVTMQRAGSVGAMGSERALTLSMKALTPNRTASVRVLTVAPRGEGAANLDAAPPPALQIAITP
ncbi:secretin N-terminal domain-containing protein [Methylibium rhizosphaerae]|uniref:secretin N-terminal domain-containing protein n=1 Tax=Methylibium rhizosphaerae TaxID=2570323 RepID=UPI0011296CAA|nr:secretin N-terminal domain-containing protein [Methylibium rhizosphaerae]